MEMLVGRAIDVQGTERVSDGRHTACLQCPVTTCRHCTTYIRLLKQAVDEVEHRCLDDVVSAYSYVILAPLLISSTER